MAQISLWMVLLAAVLGFAVGMVWYSPFLFGPAWIKLMGKTKKQMQKEMKSKDMRRIFGLTAGLNLFIAYMLGQAIVLLHLHGWNEGAMVGFSIGVGFVCTNAYIESLYAGKPFRLYLINSTHQLAALIVMGIVLGIGAPINP
jgi:hypothetical protein